MSVDAFAPERSAAPPAGAEAAIAPSGLRHRAIVRVTHWLVVFSVAGLLVTGGGILISHPRLYWGETGAVGTPSLIDLPLPFIIGPSVWNRPIHFFFAWILVFTGLTYLVAGFVTRHFSKDLLPERADLKWSRILRVVSDHLHWKRISTDEGSTYNIAQRLTYLVVIFILFPGIIWTGLAMSFGVTSVFPFLATIVGGHQSVRTLHFVFASLLVLFVIVHIAMLVLVGFTSHVRAMLTGRIPKGTGGR